MSLVDFAKRELRILHHDKDGIQDAMDKCILEIIETFCEQGHSGMSAAYATQCIERLLRWLPITPLTGEDDEWKESMDLNGKKSYQNKRCPQVFKDEDGEAYDIYGTIFSDDGGETWFTNKDSRIPVTFPYTPPLHPKKVILKEEQP